MEQWSTFHTEFTSTAQIYKMGELLKEDINHNNKFMNDQDYKEKCEVLYNLLNKACIRGDAHPKIKKYKDMNDGYLAWQELIKFYFAKGNIDAYTTTNISEISQ